MTPNRVNGNERIAKLERAEDEIIRKLGTNDEDHREILRQLSRLSRFQYAVLIILSIMQAHFLPDAIRLFKTGGQMVTSEVINYIFR